MNLTREEAVAALRDVEGAELRARTARAYQFGSPHLILWGAIWIVGYTVTGLAPGRIVGATWMILSLIGVGGAVMLNLQRLRATVDAPGAKRRGWSWFVGFAAAWLFVVATYVVMQPHSPLQYEVYPALVMGLIYSFVGAWGQPRYLLIGGLVAGLALLGYFFLAPVLPFWLAAVGGGGLIAGGVWLRQA